MTVGTFFHSVRPHHLYVSLFSCVANNVVIFELLADMSLFTTVPLYQLVISRPPVHNLNHVHFHM